MEHDQFVVWVEEEEKQKWLQVLYFYLDDVKNVIKAVNGDFSNAYDKLIPHTPMCYHGE